MLFEVLTPSPAPTITVTQTVIVPTSVPTPIITIAPPVDKIDIWEDVVWGDFGGAALGVAGALLAAWLIIRADRGSRKEEVRRTLALDYADAARRLSKQLHLPLQGEVLDEALERFELLTGRIVRQYSKRSSLLGPVRWIMARFRRHVGHSNFAIWAMVHGQPIGIKFMLLKLVIKDPDRLKGEIRRVQEQLSEMLTNLRVIEHTTLEWMRSPRTWEPDLSVRESQERVKKLVSDSESITANPE